MKSDPGRRAVLLTLLCHWLTTALFCCLEILISILIGRLLLLKGSDGQRTGFSGAGQPSPTAQHGPAQLRLIRTGLRCIRRWPQEETSTPATGPGVPEPLGRAEPPAEDQL